ncbi:MAG TPA: hypothetical protein VK308_03685 [Pyrinomonadaceae bacterium]|nr:hypothetical protein [Pyrinomonadaceae bacterium]
MNVTTNQNVPELIADLHRQNVRLSVVGGVSLRVKGEMTKTQRHAVRQLKPQIINAIRMPLEASPRTVSISQKLDAMIEAGAAFDVAEDRFEVVGSERLTEDQKQYLVVNEREVICTLHQRLLLKHWFYDSPEMLEDFAFDIYEREAILAEENELYTDEIYFLAISEISRKWFGNLLNELK